MDLAWTSDYPSKETLKREARFMAESCAEALLACIPREAIIGIWWKGSAHKAWDSPVDYVPEISDIDIHVLFADDAGAKTYLGTPEQGLAIQAEIERRYFANVPNPLHTARPQVMPLNKLLKDPNYVASPVATIATLYGRAPEPPDYADLARIRDIARRSLLEESKAVADLPWSVVDKPGRYLWTALRGITWHVAPTVPKVLVLDGVHPEEAWSLNRTRLVARLEAAGRTGLAEDYAGFYLHAWRYFLSGYSDAAAARAALLSGARAMSEGARIAASP